jgi:asparagine synthase (glutamine-hydrolysing)
MRYMLLHWNARDAAQSFAAQRLSGRMRELPGWSCALERNGFAAFCISAASHSKPKVFHDRTGVVFGTVFKRRGHDASTFVASLDDASQMRATVTHGRALVVSHWGNYIAALLDPERDTLFVLRGPASSIPCLRAEDRGVRLFFSSVEDCVQLTQQRFSIDWGTVASNLIVRVPGRRTGLREVSEVGPGECVEVGDRHDITHTYWDPLELAQDCSVAHRDEAAESLRRTVSACVHSWASCHDRIVLYLSGGLDSSIVLACLATAPNRPRIVCVTEFSAGADSDEREYARLAAARVPACTYLEQERNSHVSLAGILTANRAASPQYYFRRLEVARSQAEVAKRHEATAIFSGSGGDQVFCQSDASFVVADYLQKHRIDSRLARIVYDAAQLEGLTVWSVFRRAARGMFAYEKYNPILDTLQYKTLISARLRRDIVEGHPDLLRWRRAPRTVGPGKLSHVYAMLAMDDYYDPLGEDGDPEQVPPLFSQPLIELACRLPTYVLMDEGWERGLARFAFARELPVEIARRRSKGGIEEHSRSILQANLSFVRGLLLDGLLVEHGLLDRERLGEALGDHPSGRIVGFAEVLSHLCTEAWLRMWTEPCRQAA